MLVALLIRKKPIPKSLLIFVGFTLLFIATFYPSPSLIAPISGITILLCQEKNFIYRILAFRPITFVGIISYEVYLYHLPVQKTFLWILKIKQLNIIYSLAAFFSTLLISWISLKYFEKPIQRKLRDKWKNLK
jgi:peptidoglycan/LPS O-acetylase OafA/YrhL